MMKNILSLCTVFLLLSLVASSQQDLTQFNCSKSHWKVTSLGLNYSNRVENHGTINNHWLRAHVSEEFEPIIPDFEGYELRSRYNSIQAFIGLEKVNRKRGYSLLSRLRFGLEVTGRQNLNYTERMNLVGDSDDTMIIEMKHYAVQQNELALLTGFYKGVRFQRFTIYSGVEFGLGTSFSPVLNVITENESFTRDNESDSWLMTNGDIASEESFEALNHLSGRAEIPFGLDFHIGKSFAISSQYNWGVGMHKMIGIRSSNMTMLRSIQLGVKINL